MVPCRLCRLHQHLSTGRITFWVEWDDAGNPRLVTDDPTRTEATHTLRVQFCPMCGRRLLVIWPGLDEDRGEKPQEPTKEAEGTETAGGEQNG